MAGERMTAELGDDRVALLAELVTELGMADLRLPPPDALVDALARGYPPPPTRRRARPAARPEDARAREAEPA